MAERTKRTESGSGTLPGGTTSGEQAGTSAETRAGARGATRAEGASGAASMIEDVLLTPRVLNVGRYNELADELRALIRDASERGAELRLASEELRATQTQAGRVLDELRTRTETISRTIATIDQRLTRGEALANRAAEQAQASQEAAARVESLASRDIGAIERRIATSGEEALRELDARRTESISAIQACSANAAPALAQMLEEGTARVRAEATEIARSSAEAIATETATTIVEGIAERAISRLEERAGMIRRTLLEDALAKATDIERTTAEAIGTARTETAQLLGELGRGAQHAVERSAQAAADASHAIDRAERLVEPATLQPVRRLARDLAETIGRAEEERARLDTKLRELMARAAELDTRFSEREASLERATAADHAREVENARTAELTREARLSRDERTEQTSELEPIDSPPASPLPKAGVVSRTNTPLHADAPGGMHAAPHGGGVAGTNAGGNAGVNAGGNVEEHAITLLANRAQAIATSLDERLYYATAHAERLNTWLMQSIAQAHQTGGTLQALVMRAHLMAARADNMPHPVQPWVSTGYAPVGPGSHGWNPPGEHQQTNNTPGPMMPPPYSEGRPTPPSA